MVKCLENQSEAGFIQPRLRIFLSVDLIGSTEYKIVHMRDPATEPSWWPIVSMLFYTDFQRKFLENWENYSSVASQENVGASPKFWKAMGDELIFSKICTSQDQVVAAVQVWRRTVLDFKINWAHPELRFKTGGWLVGTPCRNWEVAFLRADSNEMDETLSGNSIVYNFNLLKQYYDETCLRKIDIDFIGPGMDCGFRILGFADERKFVMSADLAYLIGSRTGPWGEKEYASDYPALDFYYLGIQEIKGYSRSGIGYPIFWLDAFDKDAPGNSSVHAKMSDFLSGNKVINSSDVIKALDPFLKDFDGPPDRPYICSVGNDGEISEVLQTVPEEHVREINRLRELFLVAGKLETGIKESLEAGDGAGTNPEAATLDADVEELRSRQRSQEATKE